MIICKPLANDPANCNAEPLAVGHLAIVEPEALFVEVPEQVKWFDRNVGPMQPTLQEAPKVFHAVSVDAAVDVFYSVVDDGVLVISF